MGHDNILVPLVSVTTQILYTTVLKKTGYFPFLSLVHLVSGCILLWGKILGILIVYIFCGVTQYFFMGFQIPLQLMFSGTENWFRSGKWKKDHDSPRLQLLISS